MKMELAHGNCLIRDCENNNEIMNPVIAFEVYDTSEELMICPDCIKKMMELLLNELEEFKFPEGFKPSFENIEKAFQKYFDYKKSQNQSKEAER